VDRNISEITPRSQNGDMAGDNGTHSDDQQESQACTAFFKRAVEKKSLPRSIRQSEMGGECILSECFS